MENHIKEQLNRSYNSELNGLFAKWKATYSEEEQKQFCEDGLVIKHKDSGYDINEEWSKAPRRILFLVKDCPDGYGYDARRLLVGYFEGKKNAVEQSQKNAENTRQLKDPFFKNLAKILYGLYHMEEKNKGEDLNKQILNNDNLKEAFNEVPFAYIECKKLAGGKQCSPAKLAKSMERDKDNLMKEMNILKPNIIVCCDGQGTIFNHMVENYLKPFEKISSLEYTYPGEKFVCKLYHYRDKEGKDILLFNSYHPKAHVSEWKIREMVLSPFRKYLDKYGKFGNSLIEK